MIQKGMLLRTRTHTLRDVFGEVLWEVAETGLDARDKDRPGATDGVKCVLLGGTGPAARAGLVVWDSECRIEADMAAGTTGIVPPEQREALLAEYGDAKKNGRGGCGGGMEAEI